MAYTRNDGGGSAPGRGPGSSGPGVGRVTGFLLIAAAVLTFATIWLPVAVYGSAGDSMEMYVWRTSNFGGTRVFDFLPALRCVVMVIIAGVAGVMLAMGAGARRRVLFWCAALAGGMMLQTASTVVADYAKLIVDSGSHGSGFWIFTLVMLVAIAAMVTGLRDAVVSKHGVTHVAGGVADRVAGVFLVVTTAVSFGASFIPMISEHDEFETIWHTRGAAWVPWPAVQFVLGLIAVLVVAIALLAGVGIRNPAIRAASGAAAGFVLVDAISGLTITFDIMGPNFWEYAGLGFCLMVLTLLLSFAATIAGLVAQLARPRLMAQPRAGFAPGFTPQPAGMPGAANPFAAAAAAPNPFAAPTPAPNPFVSGPNPMVQNPFAPAQTGPEVETTVRIDPKPGTVQPPRMAKVYDEKDADGRPVVNRPELDGNSRMAVLAYLESAPIVLAARSFDQDEFAPTERDVPLNFRTDGVWVWAGAVSHYLHKHGLTPEPELVQHIVSRGFRVGTVDEAAKDAAIKVITGG